MDIIASTVTPAILIGGDDIFSVDVINIVAEKEVVCEISSDGRIVVALVLLLCIYIVFNFDYSV